MSEKKRGYSFDTKSHTHRFDGKRMYGVTSVLGSWGNKAPLIDWSARQAVEYTREQIEQLKKSHVDTHVANLDWLETVLEEAKTAHHKKRDRAGDKGTEVHGQLEVMMNDWIDANSAIKRNDVNFYDVVWKVQDWMLANGIKPLKSEMPVYHTEMFYAGIADGVIEKDGKKYILDFKCGSGIYDTAFIQCAAYSVAIKHMKPDAIIDGVVVVHIPKGTSFNPEKNVYWFHNIEDIEKAWLGIFTAYKVSKDLEKLIKW